MFKLNDNFKTAIRSLLVNRQRSYLTMLGMVIGIVCVVLILSLGNGLKQKATSQILTSNNKIKYSVTFIPYDSQQYVSPFNLADKQLIKNKYINTIVRFSNTNSTQQQIMTPSGPQNVNIFSIANNQTNIPVVIYGTTISHNNILDLNSILVSQKFAKQAFKSYYSALGSAVYINNQAFTIKGIFKEDINDVGIKGSDIILPTSESVSTNSQLNIYLPNKKSSNTKIKQIISLLNKQGSQHTKGKYSYVNQNEIKDAVKSLISYITIFIAIVAGISLFIAGIGIMNMMYMTISERTQEIGIRLVVGATRKDIIFQFLLEVTMISLISGVLGFIIGLAGCVLLSLVLPFNAMPSLSIFIVIIGISIIEGIAFGLAPAISASRKNIIDIIR
ncbi:MAG: ABC transporter permease [Lactobacillus iners]|uniref:ABC transporter permease n=1 Tax=Lactobacillus iners TaxID=147802 RepID=UPI003EC0976C|nr:ABC transporter permease [Lactobacillus iners]MCT7800505.1 ABC transporter permease [Lactobacillus iners]